MEHKLMGYLCQIMICSSVKLQTSSTSAMASRSAVPLIHVIYLKKLIFIQVLIWNIITSVAELCQFFTQSLVERQTPSKGIAPLMKAIRKMRLNESQLTSVHADLLQLCLMAKNLKPALEFLNVDVTDISSEVCQVSYLSLLKTN